MRIETAGWFAVYEVKGECGSCVYALREKKMSSCEYALPGFPNASRCPRYKMEMSS